MVLEEHEEIKRQNDLMRECVGDAIDIARHFTISGHGQLLGYFISNLLFVKLIAS